MQEHILDRKQTAGDSDEALLARIQAGEQALFATLLDRWGPRLLGYIRRMVRSEEAAEDLLQETFVRVHIHLAAYDPARPFKPWIYRIASNLCLDHLRRRRPVVSLDHGYGDGGSTAATPLRETLRERGPAPDEALQQQELLALLRREVAALPSKQREVFVLFHFSGLSQQEIAASLGIPVGTVKSRLFHGYERVYLNLRKEYRGWVFDALIALLFACS